ncbi:basic salivary proline-rich protein 4-like [Psammomys obesus]|uniref:basic salivary proline-rich protein 4-like n=1 Tax=Psammomys obesus TaxID=48139 RepID=UPI002452AE02|nr:basic salivary proline-rich protein 4-like [Psammomys obesus]
MAAVGTCPGPAPGERGRAPKVPTGRRARAASERAGAPDLEWPEAQNSYHAPGVPEPAADLTVPARARRGAERARRAGWHGAEGEPRWPRQAWHAEGPGGPPPPGHPRPPSARDGSPETLSTEVMRAVSCCRERAGSQQQETTYITDQFCCCRRRGAAAPSPLAPRRPPGRGPRPPPPRPARPPATCARRYPKPAAAADGSGSQQGFAASGSGAAPGSPGGAGDRAGRCVQPRPPDLARRGLALLSLFSLPAARPPAEARAPATPRPPRPRVSPPPPPASRKRVA